jgi:hypothetical protein
MQKTTLICLDEQNKNLRKWWPLKKVWRQEGGNHKPYIEGQAIQLPKRKRTNNYQQNNTQSTQKRKDRVTLIPLKQRVDLRCFGRVCSSYSTSATRRVTPVTNKMIRHEWGKDWIVIMINKTYAWSFVTQILHNG